MTPDHADDNLEIAGGIGHYGYGDAHKNMLPGGSIAGGG